MTIRLFTIFSDSHDRFNSIRSRGALTGAAFITTHSRADRLAATMIAEKSNGDPNLNDVTEFTWDDLLHVAKELRRFLALGRRRLQQREKSTLIADSIFCLECIYTHPH